MKIKNKSEVKSTQEAQTKAGITCTEQGANKMQCKYMIKMFSSNEADRVIKT